MKSRKRSKHEIGFPYNLRVIIIAIVDVLRNACTWARVTSTQLKGRSRAHFSRLFEQSVTGKSKKNTRREINWEPFRGGDVRADTGTRRYEKLKKRNHVPVYKKFGSRKRNSSCPIAFPKFLLHPPPHTYTATNHFSRRTTIETTSTRNRYLSARNNVARSYYINSIFGRTNASYFGRVNE